MTASALARTPRLVLVACAVLVVAACKRRSSPAHYEYSAASVPAAMDSSSTPFDVGMKGRLILGTKDGKAAAWVSADGTNWSFDATVPTAVGAFGHHAALGNDVVAVTDVGTVLTRKGGVWQFSTLPQGVQIHNVVLDGRSPPTFIGVGSHFAGAATSFQSTDGLTWTETADDSAELGQRVAPPDDPWPVNQMLGAVVAKNGTIVAVGKNLLKHEDGTFLDRPAIWTSSTRGASWKRVPLSSYYAEPDGNIRLLLAFEAGNMLYAVGARSDAFNEQATTMRVYRSSDAVAWQLVPLTDPIYASGGLIKDHVSVNGGSDWAVGYRLGSPTSGLRWSVDKATNRWSAEPLPAIFDNTRIIAIDHDQTGAIMVGMSTNPEGPRIWRWALVDAS